MHLGRSKERAAGPEMSEFRAFVASRRVPREEFAAIVAANSDAWIRARIASGRAGTRPPFMRHEFQARLLRVIVHPATGAWEIRESEAAVLHRLGELWPEEEKLFAAGELPTERRYLGDQAQREPGVRIVEGAEWEAMTPAEHRAVFEDVQAAAKTDPVVALPSSAPVS